VKKGSARIGRGYSLPFLPLDRGGRKEGGKERSQGGEDQRKGMVFGGEKGGPAHYRYLGKKGKEGREGKGRISIDRRSHFFGAYTEKK